MKIAPVTVLEPKKYYPCKVKSHRHTKEVYAIRCVMAYVRDEEIEESKKVKAKRANEILKEYMDGYTYKEIGKTHGRCAETIRCVVGRKIWSYRQKAKVDGLGEDGADIVAKEIEATHYENWRARKSKR